jgi:NAD(P)H-dependent FMN reductase
MVLVPFSRQGEPSPRRKARAVLVQVITGTTREGRFSSRVAAWVMSRLAGHPQFDVELVDLRDHPLPFFDADAPARTGSVYADELVSHFARTVERADGYVILTGEYNHGYPAVLKNAMDSTFVEWRRKPVAFVGWGNVGGARAVEQLRQVVVEFEMAPLRFAVHVLPDVMIAIRQSSDPDDPAHFAGLELRLAALADDLAWWTGALAAARAHQG